MKNIGVKVLSSLVVVFTIVLSVNYRNVKPAAIEPKRKPILHEETNYVSPIGDYRKTYNNEDIISEIKIDGIELDSIVTKSQDNTYYLNHDIYKKENEFGNPYIDFRNDNDLNDERQINIYSHNYYVDDYDEYLPFSKLEKYTSRDVFDSAREIYLLTEEMQIKYEVYAVKIITDDNEHTILDAETDDEWQKHIDKLLDGSLYCLDDCKLSASEKLLILQTCNYNPNGSYLLVIAKKI